MARESMICVSDVANGNLEKLWNGKDSSLIQFNKSNAALDSTYYIQPLAAADEQYYYNKHTIWNYNVDMVHKRQPCSQARALSGCTKNTASNEKLSGAWEQLAITIPQSTYVANPYIIHLVVVVTCSSSKYQFVMLWCHSRTCHMYRRVGRLQLYVEIARTRNNFSKSQKWQTQKPLK